MTRHCKPENDTAQVHTRLAPQPRQELRDLIPSPAHLIVLERFPHGRDGLPLALVCRLRPQLLQARNNLFPAPVAMLEMRSE